MSTGQHLQNPPAPALPARAAFLPDLVWAYDQATRTSEPIDRRNDPERWRQAVDSDTALTIQWDDGDHAGDAPGRLATSSASQPSVVKAMLADARLEPGMRILEIGTGTGWSAALTTHATGPGTVVSIEVDQQVWAAARNALWRAGVEVEAVYGDGMLGWPQRAPYDRAVATVGVRRIPAAWIEQTRPGGLIVAPYGTGYTHRDAVAVLTVAGDGTALGRFTGPVEFMKIRADRGETPDHGRYVGDGMAGARQSCSTLPVGAILGAAWDDPLAFVTGLAVPSVARNVDTRNPEAPTVWLYSLSDLSWAVAVLDGDGSNVWQDGPRSLWDEVEAAHGWWDRQGRPGIERFGITADGTSEVAWLDEPANVLPRVEATDPMNPAR